ncbi:hypothetical protein Tco_1278712 [Tanacetum coccineum]
MYYPRFTKAIIHHFLSKDKSISMRNRMFMHTAWDDNILGTMRFVSKYEDTQVYGDLIPKAMTNQTMLDSASYKTYLAFATGAATPKPKRIYKKTDSPIIKATATSSEETSSKKTHAKAKKKPAKEPKPAKKKASAKVVRGKGLDVLSEVALTEAAHVKEAIRSSKKDSHISHASGSGDSEEEEDDDEDENGDENDSNDDKGNDDDGDDERTDSDRDKNPILNQSDEEHDEEEAYEDKRVNTPPEYVPTDEEEEIDEEEENEVEDEHILDELYKDVNVNLEKGDVEMADVGQVRVDQQNVGQESVFEQVEKDTHVMLNVVHDTKKTEGPLQSSSVSSDFTYQLLNFENAPPADNEIASLMTIKVHHKEPSSQTSPLLTVLVTVILEIISTFTTAIPPPPTPSIPLSQQATQTPTPTATEATTSFPALLDFSSVFKFNDRVTNLEKDLSELKQVNQYAKALSFIPAIVDAYLGSKLGDAIKAAVQSHITDYKSDTRTSDWHNPEGKQYPFDLSKPLLLILDYRGRQVVHVDYFINNDLEYKGGNSSRKYTTSIIKTKAAHYEIQIIEDMVSPLWSTVKVAYDRHTYWGTSHRGPKYQRFYGFASNRFSRHDVYSKRRIIVVTHLKIMKWSDLSKRTPYTAYLDPQGIIYVDKYNRNKLMHTDELYKFSDGTLNSIWIVLNDIALRIRMEYLPKKKWSNLDRKRSRLMIKDIDRHGPSDIKAQPSLATQGGRLLQPLITKSKGALLSLEPKEKPSRANIKQALRRGSNTLSWKPCQGGIHKDGDADNLLQQSRNSLPHAHTR